MVPLMSATHDVRTESVCTKRAWYVSFKKRDAIEHSF